MYLKKYDINEINTKDLSDYLNDNLKDLTNKFLLYDKKFLEKINFLSNNDLTNMSHTEVIWNIDTIRQDYSRSYILNLVTLEYLGTIFNFNIEKHCDIQQIEEYVIAMSYKDSYDDLG